MLQSIIVQIDKIKVNKQFGDTAIYKPLLLLIIFNHVLNNGENKFAFVEVKVQLQALMEKYGWSTFSRKKAQYPFFFLASSSLWKLNINENNLKHPSSPSQKEMETAIGRLDEKIYSYLSTNPKSTQSIIDFIKRKWSLNHVIEI